MGPPLSAFHGADDHDVRAVAQWSIASSQLTVHPDGDVEVGRDPDHGQEITDGRLPTHSVLVGATGVRRRKPAHVGHEGHEHAHALYSRATSTTMLPVTLPLSWAWCAS